MVTAKRASWPLWLLAAPAFVAVWSGWVGMGKLCGFGQVQPLPGIWDTLTIDTSITLPIGMEAYAAYAIKVWLSGDASPQAVRFARTSTIAALAVGAAGQVVYHLLTAAGVTAAPWPVTALAAVLPVAVLGMGATLAHLVQQPHTTLTDAERVVTETEPTRTATTPASTPVMRAPQTHRAAGTRGRGNPSAPGRPVDTSTAGNSAGKTAARVAELLADDPHRTNAEIADRLGCSERTARRYRAEALAQLDKATRPDNHTNDDFNTETETDAEGVAA